MIPSDEVIGAMRLAFEAQPDPTQRGRIAEILLEVAVPTPPDDRHSVELLLRLVREGKLKFSVGR